MSQDDETIPFPMHTVEVLNAHTRMRRLLTHHLRREPTSEEMAERLGLTVEEVDEIAAFGAEPFTGFRGESLAHIQLKPASSQMGKAEARRVPPWSRGSTGRS
jgi:hypothetical protein